MFGNNIGGLPNALRFQKTQKFFGNFTIVISRNPGVFFLLAMVLIAFEYFFQLITLQ
jgi:hypothetical protein